MRSRTVLEQQLFDALLEASSLFDNYPETLESVGTFEVVNSALNEAMTKTTEVEV